MTNHSSDWKRCKHIEMKYHFVKDLVEQKLIQLKYVNTNDQIADILTKSLGGNKFYKFRNLILGIESN